MAYDAAKAKTATQLLKQGLSEEEAFKLAGISEADINSGEYTLNDVPGDPNRGTVEPFARLASNQDHQVDTSPVSKEPEPNPVSDTTSTTSTETVSGGGSTTVVNTPPTATAASQAYGAQANDINNQIQSINKQLGSPRFGGDPNLTENQREELRQKQLDLYAQYNAARDKEEAAKIPGTPDVITTPNTTTTTNTVTEVSASANDPVSTAEDASVAATENAATPPTIPASEINVAPAPVEGYTSTYYASNGDVITTTEAGTTTTFAAQPNESPNSPATSDIIAGVNDAQAQQARSSQAGQIPVSTDWRVRLSLAQGANYLYKDPDPGILQPLSVTNGVIFPYTPKIEMSYRANYSPYELTHSNYKGYFYQNSTPGDITVSGLFTAQNTADANYLLAVIHFFRSATKMFYGQDAQRGSPPPLVFLSGLGEYQFNNHSCLISNFTYSLPDDVDYIRAHTANQNNTNLTAQNTVKQSVAINASQVVANRLANAGTTVGALPAVPFGSPSSPLLASGAPTYVPTKMTISIQLLPVNTRKQVSTQFSLKGFANGNLLRGGFW